MPAIGIGGAVAGVAGAARPPQEAQVVEPSDAETAEDAVRRIKEKQQAQQQVQQHIASMLGQYYSADSQVVGGVPPAPSPAPSPFITPLVFGFTPPAPADPAGTVVQLATPRFIPTSATEAQPKKSLVRASSVVGTLAGAGLGAVAGWQLAEKKRQRGAMTAGGVLVGALVGGLIGAAVG